MEEFIPEESLADYRKNYDLDLCAICGKYVNSDEKVVIDEVNNVSIPNCLKCVNGHRTHHTCFFGIDHYGKHGQIMCPRCSFQDIRICASTKTGGKRKTTKKRKTIKKRKSYRKK